MSIPSSWSLVVFFTAQTFLKVYLYISWLLMQPLREIDRRIAVWNTNFLETVWQTQEIGVLLRLEDYIQSTVLESFDWSQFMAKVLLSMAKLFTWLSFTAKFCSSLRVWLMPWTGGHQLMLLAHVLSFFFLSNLKAVITRYPHFLVNSGAYDINDFSL